MRGFNLAQYEFRTLKAQQLMQQHELGALLLTTETNVRYFTGFLTRFWESPTRPWYLIIPQSGKPIAVIPSIGEALMSKTWVEDIRTWPSPDLTDDGISLLSETLNEVAKKNRVGIPSGAETHVRIPRNDLIKLSQNVNLSHDFEIVKNLRMIKSKEEIIKIENACMIAKEAFSRVPEIASENIRLDEVFRRFQVLCLEAGADWVPYLAGGADTEGYDDVISPAKESPLKRGDLLMLDTGLVWDGYFCDYDRNWSIGAPSSGVKEAYSQLLDASDAAFELAKPGAMASDLFHAMNSVLTKNAEGTDAGRLGHGVGMSLTEWPSLIPDDDTVLETGMVLSLEPGITLSDKIIVHEENIEITETGARYLSPKANKELPVI
ncbi:MAG: aminopeptidase P family protein [Rhodobacteraceae bacterium]|nr:aminopeptidase P family protein [Paracoccaceae bacterium]